MNSIAPSASAPISAFAELSNEITISIFDYGTDCRGTRAQLVADGLVPDSVQWPAAGYNDVTWDDGAVIYRLRRVRPDGAKGPRSAFAQVDYWSLRTVLCRSQWAAREIAVKRAELDATVRSVSPEGRAEMERRLDAAIAAHHDEGFQAFKAMVPGFARRARQSKGAAA